MSNLSSVDSLRFSNLSAPYLVYDPLREGVERCPFPISIDSKMMLLKK